MALLIILHSQQNVFFKDLILIFCFLRVFCSYLTTIYNECQFLPAVSSSVLFVHFTVGKQHPSVDFQSPYWLAFSCFYDSSDMPGNTGREKGNYMQHRAPVIHLYVVVHDQDLKPKTTAAPHADWLLVISLFQCEPTAYSYCLELVQSIDLDTACISSQMVSVSGKSVWRGVSPDWQQRLRRPVWRDHCWPGRPGRWRLPW